MQKYFYVWLTIFVLGILFVGYILFTPENENQKITLEIGETHLLDAKQNVIFESDNNLIATVESNSGLITAISVGTTRVTAKKNNKIIFTYLVEVKAKIGTGELDISKAIR